MNFEDLNKEVERQHEGRRLSLNAVQGLESEISNLTDHIQILTKVEELFKHLLDRYVNKYAESFSLIVSEGLQAIFSDQDLRFEINVRPKNGKVWVEFDTIQNGVRGPALKSFGGGVSSVESLLLRILVLLKTGLSRYLILDESLAALSEHYVDSAGAFIKEMCSSLGVNVLLITHNKAYLDHADNAYQATAKADGSLKLNKL